MNAVEKIRHIKLTVANHAGITVEEMESQRRPQYIAWPRQIAMSLAYELPRISLNSVGQFFGNRDHSTVLHAVRTVRARADVAPEDRKTVECLRHQLGWIFTDTMPPIPDA